MPTYEFRCPKGHEFERFYKTMSTAPMEQPCPECGAVGARQLSGGGGLVFKGSGFYLTDYGKNAHRGGAPEKKGDGGEKSESSKVEGSKPDGGKSDGSKSDAASGKGDGGKSSGAKPDGGSAGGGSAKSESTKSDSSRSESPKPSAHSPKPKSE